MGVINFARNRISSLKVFHFLLYPWSSIYFLGYLLFISYSTLFEYACINTQKSIRGKLPHCQKGRAWPLTKLQVTVEIIGRGEGGGGGLEGLPMPRHCVIMIFCRTTVSARLETITRTHWLKDERVHNINKIKGLYEPTLESIEGFVLICSKSNILQDVCVGGVGGRAFFSQLRVAVSSW